jgi:hypothetical protein
MIKTQYLKSQTSECVCIKNSRHSTGRKHWWNNDCKLARDRNRLEQQGKIRDENCRGAPNRWKLWNKTSCGSSVHSYLFHMLLYRPANKEEEKTIGLPPGRIMTLCWLMSVIARRRVKPMTAKMRCLIKEIIQDSAQDCQCPRHCHLDPHTERLTWVCA